MPDAEKDARPWICACGFDAKKFEPRPECVSGAIRWHEAVCNLAGRGVEAVSDDPLDEAAVLAGRQYGMTSEQVITHLALGNVPHPDAPVGVCGASDPRDDRYWCVEQPGHGGEHSRYAHGDTADAWWKRWDAVRRSRSGRRPCGPRPISEAVRKFLERYTREKQ